MKGASIEKSGLHDLYKVEKEKWEDAVIRTQGSSNTVKAIDTAKQVKEPLTKKYKEWQGIYKHHVHIRNGTIYTGFIKKN